MPTNSCKGEGGDYLNFLSVKNKQGLCAAA